MLSILQRRSLTLVTGSLLLAGVGLGAAVTPTPANAEVVPPPSTTPDPSLTERNIIDPGAHLVEFALPNPLGAPNDVAAGPDGSVWVSVFNDKQILRVSRDGAVLATHQLTGGPTNLTTDADGGVWASEYASNAIAHVDAAGTVSEIRLPTANAFPSAVEASGAHVYFTESNNHGFGRITRATGAVEEFPLPGSVSPSDIRSTTAGIWVTDPSADTVWRAGGRGEGVRPFGQAGDMVSFADSVNEPNGVNAFSPLRATGLLAEAPPRAVERLSGRSRLAGTAGFTRGDQVWFADAGTNSIGWTSSQTFGSLGEVIVPTSAADLAGTAVTEGRYFWAVERQGGKLVRVDVLLSTSTARIAGADRYETASAVAREGHAAGAEILFVASGETFADALAGGPVAARLSAPMLLTRQDNLPDPTRRALKELRPKRVIILGGAAAVSEAVARSIEDVTGVKPERIGGPDRYAVSRALASSPLSGAPAQRIYIATGRDFPDALGATSVAAKQNGVTLLVDGKASELTPAERTSLTSLAKRPGVEAVVVGGPSAISPSLEAAISSIVKTTRVGGADRFAVAASLNRDTFGLTGFGFVASGGDFADALAGGVLAGTQQLPLYLARKDCVPEVTGAAIVATGVYFVRLIGGSVVLNKQVETLTTC
ncbi:cell wall-binding repeat-containing protein [Herbiconiux sp. VKM Ac-2851]|uniref:cell wall-binding repeat-containing protein n=1 Tax=Herbiconiux sp. VKM Ac-2851 TaxID=2739025 RepID=UPI0015654FCB|nr:cell wall-binding repeat-containing protein [Herbiconiux sp. VKM Ac-2851]NQX34912.1 cell wall-binding repeat-containing protein [Herbiconiux sp. VKM Ac-2851]